MLKKALFLISLTCALTLYAFNIFPYKSVELTLGKGSNCKVINGQIAMFYDSVAITKNAGFNYQNIVDSTGAQLVFVEQIDGVISYYYFSNNLPKIADINGKKVNLHIAVSGEKVKVGTPLIYGGF